MIKIRKGDLLAWFWVHRFNCYELFSNVLIPSQNKKKKPKKTKKQKQKKTKKQKTKNKKQKKN